MDELSSMRVQNLITRFELDLNRAKAAMLLSGDRELAPNEFRISSLAYCDRWIWYTKHGYREVVNYDNVQSGVLPGTAIHEAIEHYYPANSGVEIEKSVRKEYIDSTGFRILVTGTIDLRYPGLIVDLKSAEKWAFSQTTDIKPHHLKQVSCYAEITGDPFVAVTYLSKDTLEHMTLVEKPIPHYLTARLPALKIIAQAATAADVPANPSEKWFCKYCPGADDCKKVKQGQIRMEEQLLDEIEAVRSPPKVHEKEPKKELF